MEKHDIKISVIVPVYNTEKYLKKCLLSLQNQQFDNFEVIVINDGSPDNSKEIINRFLRDQRFKLIDKENGGLSSARNAGLAVARGEFVCFVDSDDWLKAEYLKNLYEYAKDDVDVVIGRYILNDTILKKNIIIGQENKQIVVYQGKEKEDHILRNHIGPYSINEKESMTDTLMCVWKNLYRKQMIDDNDIKFVSERKIMLEDYEFNLKAYYFARKIALSNGADYVHVIVENSLSRRYRPDLCDMMLNLYEYCRKFIKAHEFYDINKVKQQLDNFLKKQVVDICYNQTFSKATKKDLVAIVSRPQIKNIFEQKRKLRIPFYYKFFIRLMELKQFYLLKVFMVLARKMNYFYRVYRMIRK